MIKLSAQTIKYSDMVYLLSIDFYMTPNIWGGIIIMLYLPFNDKENKPVLWIAMSHDDPKVIMLKENKSLRHVLLLTWAPL